MPAFSRPDASAIEKQPASAAPIISSGFDPDAPSKRVETENGTSGPCSGFIVPRPFFSIPSHVAVALLVGIVRSLAIAVAQLGCPLQAGASVYLSRRMSVARQ